jgi:hypothetical protein
MTGQATQPTQLLVYGFAPGGVMRHHLTRT